MRSGSRVLLVATVATLLAGAVLAWLLPGLRAELTSAPSDFVDTLVLGCTAAAVATTCWLWVLVCLVLLDEVRGRRSPRRGVPAGVRRVVLVACGATLVGGLALPAHAAHVAHADRAGPPPAPDDPAATTALLVGLPLPDRTTTTTEWIGRVSSTVEAPEQPQPEPPEGVDVVVGPGDTLWGVARDSLPADATTEEVDRRWRAIYRANRDAVGADPDLIRPGLRLQLPDGARPRPAGGDQR